MGGGDGGKQQTLAANSQARAVNSEAHGPRAATGGWCGCFGAFKMTDYDVSRGRRPGIGAGIKQLVCLSVGWDVVSWRLVGWGPHLFGCEGGVWEVLAGKGGRERAGETREE